MFSGSERGSCTRRRKGEHMAGSHKSKRRLMITTVSIVALSFLFLMAQSGPSGLRIISGADSPTASGTSISQHGITWTFSEEVEYGQFVNGDYWVVGPVRIMQVDPAPAVVNDRSVHGSELNPIAGYQGYDSGAPRYDASRSASFPLDIVVGAANPVASLVSTISFDTTQTSPRPALNDAAVLTVLHRPPAGDVFRPGAIGTDKTMYRYADVNWSLIEAAEVAPVSGAPDLQTSLLSAGDGNFAETWQDTFQRPWLIQNFGYQHRHIMPRNNSPSYHQYVAKSLAFAAVAIVTDLPNKETLIRNYIQVGIDYYTALSGPGVGPYNYFFPTVFAGLVLGDTDMLNFYVNERNNYPEYHALEEKVYFANRMTSGVLPVRNAADTHDLGEATPWGRDTYTGYWARTGRRPVFYANDYGNIGELHPSEWEDYYDYRPWSYTTLHSVSIPAFTLAAALLGVTDKIGPHADPYVAYAHRWMYETSDILVDSHITDSSWVDPGFGGVATTQNSWVDAMWYRYEPDIY